MKKHFLLLMVLSCASLCMHAVPRASVRTHIIGGDTDSTAMAGHFTKNAPARMNKDAAAAPSFAFVTKNGKFMLGVGGSVKVTVGYDMGHPIQDMDEFTTSEIPMQPMDGNGARFDLSAAQTGLYLNFIALPGDKNQIGAFLSFNLLDNYKPNLQYAYLKYRGFQAGYDYNLFSDPGACPPTIDYEGPNSFTACPTAGIRYGVDFGRNKAFRFSLGAELPFESFTTMQRRTANVNQRVPDIPVALQYSWGGGDSWVRVSGVIRNMYYRNLVTAKNVDKVGFGVQLSGKANILPQLTAYYQAVYGKGIGSYIQDLYGLGCDLMPEGDNGGMQCVESWGAYGGLRYQFSPKVSCSATYSHVRNYAKNYEGGSTAWRDQYRYGQYVVANVFYNISPYFQTGLEYLWGRRVNYDNMKCADTRVQAMFQLTF